MSHQISMRSHLFITLCVCCLSMLSSLAIEPDRLFFKGQEAYDAGDYIEAVEWYEQILEDGSYSAELFYNLGNAYYQQGDPGRAILNYRRAERLMPADADLKNNLRFVREQTGAEMPATNPVMKVLQAVSHSKWMGLVFACFILLPLLFLLLLFFSVSKAWWIRVSVVGGTLLVLGLAGGHVTAPQNAPAEVVILNDNQAATFEPLAASKVHFTLPVGSVVIAEESLNGMTKVRSGKVGGWIPDNACEAVSLSGS